MIKTWAVYAQYECRVQGQYRQAGDIISRHSTYDLAVRNLRRIDNTMLAIKDLN